MDKLIPTHRPVDLVASPSANARLQDRVHGLCGASRALLPRAQRPAVSGNIRALREPPRFRVLTAARARQVEFSPYDETKLACSTAQHFGIVGAGRQYVFNVTRARLEPVAHIDYKEGIFDCAWSEGNSAHLAFGTGDGSVRSAMHRGPARR